MAEKQLSPEEEQERWLQEASNVVKTHAFAMKRSLDLQQLMDALKHASSLICELRTSLLSPKNYYSLYMRVMDELRHLQSYFYEEHRKGKRIAELYELVQHAGNVLPRLYLLVTVGAIFIQSREAPAGHVLRDMVEMCRGVQHPTRGLFLRNYLLSLCKDKLPDKGGEYDGSGGSTAESVDFILQNFTEMNKLWVRMAHQGTARDKERREQERRQLCVLVGTNLVRISQLDGVDVATYKELVLPKVLEQVINCKDDVAQNYLLDSIIQAFPDEYHLQTLKELLGGLSKLEATVDVKKVVVDLIKRLIKYASNEDADHSAMRDIDVFGIFEEQVANIIQTRELQLVDALTLCVALLDLSLSFYTDNLEYVDRVMKFTTSVVKARKIDTVSGRANLDQLVALLTKPLEHYTPVAVLALEAYPAVMKLLDFQTRVRVAKTIASAVIKRGKVLGTPDKVSKLFGFLAPLVRDEADSPKREADDEEFVEEQSLVARLVHLVDARDTDVAFQLYEGLKRLFAAGGEARSKHTLVPLLFSALRLAKRIKAREEAGDSVNISTKKAFQLCHEIGTAAAPLVPTLALPLFLQSAHVAAETGYESIAYEFITQAFIIYETEYSGNSRLQYEAVALIAGSLYAIKGLLPENYDTLVLKVTQHSANLLKKEDKVRGVCNCSHLFCHDAESGLLRDPKRVLECLQKGLKIADSLMDAKSKTQLFVEILDQYLYYFAQDAMPARSVNQLIALVNTNMDESASEALQRHYKNTLDFVRLQKLSDPRFADIETP
eukprot:TRINITY_DN5666_c0_g1_i1.p1 TRINITY_DN5666_c0_g1~~TRINITY_DN5666_c0_g1_i1.p1  ORF type:complete len:792 (+),score=211.75 TRINITY_DN5666_c0_g1_i1:45-2378(+)